MSRRAPVAAAALLAVYFVGLGLCGLASQDATELQFAAVGMTHIQVVLLAHMVPLLEVAAGAALLSHYTRQGGIAVLTCLVALFAMTGIRHRATLSCSPMFGDGTASLLTQSACLLAVLCLAQRHRVSPIARHGSGCSAAESRGRRTLREILWVGIASAVLALLCAIPLVFHRSPSAIELKPYRGDPLVTRWKRGAVDLGERPAISLAAARAFGPAAVWYDVRSPREFAEGHVAGATLLTGGNLEQRIRDLLANGQHETPVIVYGNGSDAHTQGVARVLAAAGLKKVFVLRDRWTSPFTVPTTSSYREA